MACWAQSCAVKFNELHAWNRYQLLHHVRCPRGRRACRCVGEKTAHRRGGRARTSAVRRRVSAYHKAARASGSADERRSGRARGGGLREHAAARRGRFVHAGVSGGRKHGARHCGGAGRAVLCHQSPAGTRARCDGGFRHSARRVCGDAFVRRNDRDAVCR